jgi:uncharacterized Tic20 family protein
MAMSTAPIKPEDSVYPELPNYSPNADDRTWGMMAHLSGLIAMLLSVGSLAFLGPLLVWLIKRDMSPFIDDQGKEALNFQLSALIAAVVCAATCIGLPLVIVVGLGAIIYPIIGGMEANKGVYYRYPYTFRLIK